jgi:NADH:ubiquinone oxidoreductase subunit E
MEPSPKKILVCVNERLTDSKPSCGGRGGQALATAIEQGVKERDLDIPVERFICFGFCNEGPNVRFTPAGKFFHHTTLEDVPAILDEAERFAKEPLKKCCEQRQAQGAAQRTTRHIK